MNTCKRTCCWNPYGLCSRKQNCACHQISIQQSNATDWATGLEAERAASLNRGKR